MTNHKKKNDVMASLKNISVCKNVVTPEARFSKVQKTFP